MGVKFSKDESEKIIHAMENNLKLANEIITRLSSGCSHLQNSLNSGELSGAAYKAGSSLFAKIIIPTIKKLKAAVNDIKAELKSYKYAHTVAVEACIGGYADLEMFQQQVRIKKAKIQVIDEQLRTNQNFINQAIALFSGNWNNLLNQSSDLVQSKKQLEYQVNDFETRIKKLQWFVSDVARYFSDSLTVLNLAIKGAMELKKITVDGNGNYHLNGADMSWLNKIKDEDIETNGIKKYGKQITDLPKEYQEKIKAIQDNKNLTTEEKADKIVSVYEDFLYSLASEAFDEYTKMRKKEHKGSIEWAKGELKLTNKLMGCNVDIKSLVRHLGDDIILISDKKGWNYIQFINMVNTGKPLDLKARVCKNTNFSIWARNWSDKMTIKGENRADDYLGNYLFGYYGQGVLKLGGKNIVMGAGVAQTLSNLKNKKIKITKKIDGLYQGVGAIENMVFNGGVQVVGDAVKSIPNKKVKNIGNKIDNLGENIPSFPLEDGPYSMLHGYGDNAGDGEMIKEGIEDYEKLHK